MESRKNVSRREFSLRLCFSYKMSCLHKATRGFANYVWKGSLLHNNFSDLRIYVYFRPSWNFPKKQNRFMKIFRSISYCIEGFAKYHLPTVRYWIILVNTHESSLYTLTSPFPSLFIYHLATTQFHFLFRFTEPYSKVLNFAPVSALNVFSIYVLLLIFFRSFLCYNEQPAGEHNIVETLFDRNKSTLCNREFAAQNSFHGHLKKISEKSISSRKILIVLEESFSLHHKRHNSTGIIFGSRAL